MNTWQSSKVEANGIRLRITRTGGNKRPLVLVHGVTDDGLCWTPAAEALSTDYDVIMVDARGHGQSDAPDSGYDLITLVNDLYGVIQALRLNKSLMIGHSLGAVTTLLMAGLYPAVPGAIVLEDPPSWWVKGPVSEFLQRTGDIKEWAFQLKSQTREQIIAEGHRQNPRWSEAELEPWADSKVRLSLKAINGLFAPDHAARIDWTEALRRISCPVCVVTADLASGAALDPASVEALRVLVPHLRVEHIANAGHNIHREQFAPYMDTVRAFLAGIPAA